MKKTVTTFYLEMNDISQFKPKEGFKEILEIKPISNDVFQQWMLFVGVGLPWQWYSRLSWSASDWVNYLANNKVETYMAFSNSSLVGYFEILYGKNNAAEITFLGLFESSIGKGFGGALLSHAVDVAWALGVEKVWLHTCTTDHTSALSNYLGRGFKIMNEITEEETFPDKDDYLKHVSNFMSSYIDSQNSYWK